MTQKRARRRQDKALSPTPPLPSDELGDVGEAKFKYLCSRAPMVANKAERDRFGWDYVVQLAADNPEATPLDARDTHLTAFVQVKATWRGAKSRIRLSLSAAEKLAKHRAASFIVGLAFDRDGDDDCDIHVLEMRGAVLAKVLKALRAFEKRGERAVNDATISFDLNTENRLTSHTPSALKARLASSFSNSEGAYIAAKDRELATLGYDDERYQVVFSTIEGAPFETVEFLLGERELVGEIRDAVETRFKIPLPSDFIPTGGAKVTLRPEPLGACRLKITGAGLSRPLTFEGEYFYAAVACAEGVVWKAKAGFDLFSIERDARGFRFKSSMSIEDTRSHPIARWIAFHRISVAQTTGPIELALRGAHLGQPWSWKFPHRPEKDGDLHNRLELFETAERVLAEVGRVGEAISAKSIYRHQKEIYTAAGMSIKGARRVQIGFKREREGDEEGEEIVRLYVGLIDFGAFRVATAARVIMRPRVEEDGRHWFTGEHEPVALEAIGTSPTEFRDFVEDAKGVSGLDDVLIDKVDADFLNEALGELDPF